MKTAVLIPCYNEEKTIKDVVADFHRELPDADIYVYENNCTDKTVERAKEGWSGVQIRHEYRQGKGNVIRSMFRDINADQYLLVDGDNTYPVEKAKEMLKLVEEGRADMVVGDRLATTYFKENKRPFHNVGNKLVCWLIRHLFKTRVHDIMTGYRAFSRDFVKGFPVISHGFEIETEMTIHAVDKNYKIVEIPVEYRDRPKGSSSKLNTVSDGLRVLHTIAKLFKEYKPMRFFNIIALIFYIAGIILMFPAFEEYFVSHFVTKVPRLMIGALSVVLGLLLTITGIILDVIIKKQREEYEITMTMMKMK